MRLNPTPIAEAKPRRRVLQFLLHPYYPLQFLGNSCNLLLIFYTYRFKTFLSERGRNRVILTHGHILGELWQRKTLHKKEK